MTNYCVHIWALNLKVLPKKTLKSICIAMRARASLSDAQLSMRVFLQHWLRRNPCGQILRPGCILLYSCITEYWLYSGPWCISVLLCSIPVCSVSVWLYLTTVWIVREERMTSVVNGNMQGEGQELLGCLKLLKNILTKQNQVLNRMKGVQLWEKKSGTYFFKVFF